MEKDEFKDILNIDFPEIKADANRYYEYCINKNKKRKSKMHKSIFMIVYTLLICIISVATTTLFFNLLSNNNQKKPIENKNNGQTDKPIAFDVDPGKIAQSLVNTNYIDYCVAFGVDGIEKIKSSELYDLDIISEEDKVVLKEMDQKNGVRYINLYFAVKDNKDIIVISYLERPFGEDGILIFDSNIDFAFNELVNEFEDIIGESIDYNFLNQRYQESSEQLLPSGIYLELLKDNEFYDYKFTIFYKNQEHIIFK